jgi:hypothetical protein
VNDFERVVREALAEKAESAALGSPSEDVVFRRAIRRRAMYVSGFVVAIAIVAAGAVAGVRALPLGTNNPPDPIEQPTPSPSPLPTPTPCPFETGDLDPNGQCGNHFEADLDGDGRSDEAVLLVSLDEDSLPESAELRAVLASGESSAVDVEVAPGSHPLFPFGMGDESRERAAWDLDGDGRHEVLLSIAQSGAGREFVRMFVWDDGALREVTTNGDPFDFVLGGSVGNGGMVECTDVDGDSLREVIVRTYQVTSDGNSFEVTETVFELDGSEARRAEPSETRTISPAELDDRFRTADC